MWNPKNFVVLKHIPVLYSINLYQTQFAFLIKSIVVAVSCSVFSQTLHRARQRFPAKFSGKTNTKPNLYSKLTLKLALPPSPNYNPWCGIEKGITPWHTYPPPRLNQKVLSRLAEYDDIIRGPPFQPCLGLPNPGYHGLHSVADAITHLHGLC